VLVLAALVALTFVWGFYLLDTYEDDDYFGDVDDLSVSEFLFRDVAAPGVQRLYELVAPAMVGIGGSGVNANVVATGAIVGPSGYVLTVSHSLSGLAEISVHVRTPGGIRRYRAEIVKSHEDHGLVLLKMLTSDRFLFFALADTRGLQPGQRVFAFGHGVGGSTVVKQGSILGTNISLIIGGTPLSSLLATDAVYSWEQTGGPLINAGGELLAINLALEGASGMIDGYAVPAHVIAAHFQDVVDFKMAPPRGTAAGVATAVPVAGGAPRPGTGPAQAGLRTGSAAWWARAQARVAWDDRPLGMNVAAGQAPRPPAAAIDREHLDVARIGGYPVRDVLGLALLGLVAGITGGMMTMGGGVLQVAGMMILFGYGMYLIRPVAYLTNIFVYGAATLRNRRSGLIVWDQVRALAPWAVAGVVAGYFIGNAMGDEAIAVILGVFALLVAVKGLHEILADDAHEILVRTDGGGSPGSRKTEDALDDFLVAEGRADGPSAGTLNRQARNAGLGLPMGLVSGVLGISGGVVGVPLQRFLGGASLRNAIANCSVLVFWASLAGALVAFTHGIGSGLIDWRAPVTLALIMIPGAYVGGLVGARLMKVLPVVALKCFYTAIMAAISVKMLFDG
jgi:hypothetical protein